MPLSHDHIRTTVETFLARHPHERTQLGGLLDALDRPPTSPAAPPSPTVLRELHEETGIPLQAVAPWPGYEAVPDWRRVGVPTLQYSGRGDVIDSVVLSSFRGQVREAAVGKGRRCMELLGQDVDAPSTRFLDGMQVFTRRGSGRGIGGFDLNQQLPLQLVHLVPGKERQPKQAVAAVYGGTEVELESIPALPSRHLLISVLYVCPITAATPAPPTRQSLRRLVPPFRIIELVHCPKQGLHVNAGLCAELPCPRKSLMRDHNHGDHEGQDGGNKRRRIGSGKACAKERPDCANTSRVGDGAK